MRAAALLHRIIRIAAAAVPVGIVTLGRFIVQAALMAPIVLLMRLDWRAAAALGGKVSAPASLLRSLPAGHPAIFGDVRIGQR